MTDKNDIEQRIASFHVGQDQNIIKVSNANTLRNQDSLMTSCTSCTVTSGKWSFILLTWELGAYKRRSVPSPRLAVGMKAQRSVLGVPTMVKRTTRNNLNKTFEQNKRLDDPLDYEDWHGTNMVIDRAIDEQMGPLRVEI
jgi:hypothetical protein